MFVNEKQKKDLKDDVKNKDIGGKTNTPNATGIPDVMKGRFENLSGFSFDDVRVHYNSEKPAQLQAFAYTQGNQVHIGPGQEKHLGHELGHVVQQKEGRVQSTVQLQGINVNDDAGLEREADNMGEAAAKETSYFSYADRISKTPTHSRNMQFKQYTISKKIKLGQTMQKQTPEKGKTSAKTVLDRIIPALKDKYDRLPKESDREDSSDTGASLEEEKEFITKFLQSDTESKAEDLKKLELLMGDEKDKTIARDKLNTNIRKLKENGKECSNLEIDRDQLNGELRVLEFRVRNLMQSAYSGVMKPYIDTRVAEVFNTPTGRSATGSPIEAETEMLKKIIRRKWIGAHLIKDSWGGVNNMMNVVAWDDEAEKIWTTQFENPIDYAFIRTDGTHADIEINANKEDEFLPANILDGLPGGNHDDEDKSKWAIQELERERWKINTAIETVPIYASGDYTIYEDGKTIECKPIVELKENNTGYADFKDVVGHYFKDIISGMGHKVTEKVQAEDKTRAQRQTAREKIQATISDPKSSITKRAVAEKRLGDMPTFVSAFTVADSQTIGDIRAGEEAKRSQKRKDAMKEEIATISPDIFDIDIEQYTVQEILDLRDLGYTITVSVNCSKFGAYRHEIEQLQSQGIYVVDENGDACVFMHEDDEEDYY